MGFKEVGCEGRELFYLAEGRVEWRTVGKFSVSIKAEEFLDRLTA